MFSEATVKYGKITVPACGVIIASELNSNFHFSKNALTASLAPGITLKCGGN